jgi:tetratricopeptide (TPR) repeat protein
MVEEAGVRAFELAEEALARFDGEAAAGHLSVAVRELTAAGDNRRAAMACARLGGLFSDFMGNNTAARAWFVRATRLIEDEPACLEQGWVAVASLGCDVSDPEVLLANATLALDRARRFGDVNLETKALADAGLAHVQAGRVEEGMALLAEAMALATGAADHDEAAGKSVCSFLTACYFACDFERAATWADVLRRRGLLGQAAGVPILVGNHCDAVQATLLCELGLWGEAERLLLRAIDEFEAVMGVPSWHPAIALAELRIRQGRLTDAEQLLLGKEGRFQALLPAARLHLARGDTELARATAERGLRTIGDDRLRAVELLSLLVDVELAAGDTDAASQRCAELAERSKGVEVPALSARIAMTRAHALAASGATGDAIAAVESALDALPETRLPLVQATLLAELAHLHDAAGDAVAARVEAARAAAAFGALDVVVPPAAAALISRLQAPWPSPSTAAPAAAGVGTGAGGVTLATLIADGRGWTIAVGDIRARIPRSKGMSYLAELVRNPGVERHALDLVDGVEGAGAEGVDRRRLGDAGPMLDGRARIAYRHRIEELRAEVEEALAAGALEKAEALEDELDKLVAELGRAFGLGGRERAASSAAEKARLNVTRALRTAVERVMALAPEAGDVLDRGLRTGTYCCFAPKPGEPIRWTIQA